jgi:hypothetical protein
MEASLGRAAGLDRDQRRARHRETVFAGGATAAHRPRAPAAGLS